MNSAPHAAMREATGDDVDCLVVMMRKLAQQEPSVPFDPAAVRDLWGVFLSRPEFGRAWLIDVQAKSVGYVILTLGFSFEYHGREAFIDELYLEEEFRGMGLGTQAMKFVSDQAQALGVRAIHLEVDPQNDHALSLYRRLGYVDHDRRLMTEWLTPTAESNTRT